MKFKTIRINNQDAKRLATFGIKTSTWNDIITDLMNHADKTNFQVGDKN